ncbi:CotH kinase family protein [Alkaliflexus imshenetskii]|uniref:CotH kinase family protein n=1 Tax=Alkaliflexus imshenetskii TaxID=286730 RepID=UPI00047E6204|nr:CotH kinase family protein [Alkaliflexus imshenetskii]
MLTRKIFVTLCLLFLIVTVNANETIQINQNQYFIDLNKKLVLTNIGVELVNSTWNGTKNHIYIGEACEFLNPVTNIEIGVEYLIFIPSQNTNFSLFFTELPIISINTDNTIVDEPNVLANFKMIETNQNYLESYVGIQYRGASSQSYPKKSMEIEFWTDNTGNTTQDYSLLGMVNDDDWNLQAMYNEPLRIRSKTNNDLWRMINTLHYQNQEPEAINGIRMKYVELFVNNEYRGLYCLGEKVNRKQLKLKKHNGTIRGELYKGVSWGASTFKSIPPYDNNSLYWSGFEYKHPDEETNWSNIYELVDFVINSSDNDFYNQYKERFELDNLVDYYIFLNLLRATDNTGKNLYIAKYNTNSKYFYVPWDLDGTFGIIWNGTKDNTTNDILTNGLYNRLKFECSAGGFLEKLKNRWNDLRSSVIAHESIMSLFSSNYNFLERNGIYDREKLAWTGYVHESNSLDYISSWLTNRLSYLDQKFNEECNPLSSKNLTPNDNLIQIFPNPTDDLIYINTELSHGLIVSVYNNLGKLVLQESLSQSSNKISLKNLTSGIYFIQVKNDEHFEVQKIILTKSSR